ncbi:uncharacterized protein L201_006826 [Kwoniella dendrophila CBS 6074]|uniref:Rrn9 domain-containing protein n=1 Tax=Kwoniella dendrophila CBS 6074 TaxID=1295534 RepID=A0AAX4K2R4_9TREE
MTATGRKPAMHLALPPSIGMSRIDSDDSAPSTPGPHTPLPYDFVSYFNVPSPNIDTMQLDESSSISVGSKRGRDEEDERFIEQEWTEEEIDVIQSTLIHPFRPVSTSYPPGELPPAKVLDELTNQIINYAFRNLRSSSPISDEDPSLSSSKLRSPEDTSRGGWKHKFDSTRKKLFDIALNESKLAFGFDLEDKKKLTSREERISSSSSSSSQNKSGSSHSGRPGLRRVDSMDFLDQVEDESETTTKPDNVGRALRLSTTLQNSAKQEPLLSLTRSTSVGSGLMADSPLCSLGPSVAPVPPIAAITLTPASPTGPTTTSKPQLRCKPSLRNLSARPARPTSLLQRGRSFTADDLKAEAEANPSSDDKIPSSPSHGEISDGRPIISPTSTEMVTSPISMLTFQPLPSCVGSSSTRLTRSHSSSSTLYPQPHAIQKAFLQNPKPSTNDRSILALPLPIDDPSSSTTKVSSSSGGGWSDSEDEFTSGQKQPRKIKKLKQNKQKLDLGGGLRGPSMPISLDKQQMLLPETAPGGLGLRSPFEEKDEPQFI